MSEELTVERLKEVLKYEAATGLFWWIERKQGRTTNKPAGCVNKIHGYALIGIDGKLYKAHRLAWFYINGKWPDHMIDHINGIKHDNRIENLRDVTRDINGQNQHKATKQNKSTGLLGVYYDAQRKKYSAQITVNGSTKHLGRFNTPQEAHQVYLEAKRQYHPGCTI